MALESSLVPVLFDKALDQKNNYKVQLPGTFLALENVVRRKGSLWEKRYGTTSVPKTVMNGGNARPTIASGVALGRLTNDALCLMDGKVLFNYAATANGFTYSDGDATSIGWSHHSLVRSSASSGQADIAYCNGYIALTWNDARLGLSYAVYDAATGATVFAPTALPNGSGGAFCKVAATGTSFIFAHDDGATALYTYRIDVPVNGTPSIFGSGLVSPITYAFGNIDLETYDSGAVVLVCNSATANHLWLGYVLVDGSIGNGSNGYAAPLHYNAATATVPAGGILTAHVYSNRIYVLFKSSIDNTLRCTIFNNALTTYSFATQIATDTIRNATVTPRANGAPLNDGRNEYAVYFEVGSPSASNDGPLTVVKVCYLGAWDGIQGSQPSQDGALSTRVAGVGLASKAFFNSNDQCVYFYAAYETELQPTYYLMRDTGNPYLPGIETPCIAVAKFAQGSSAGLSKNISGSYTSSLLPRIASDGAGNYHSALMVITSREQVQQGLATNPYIFGVDHYSVNFSGNYVCTNLCPGLQMAAGGMVHQYDGTATSEIGFNNYPEGITSTAATTGGTLAAGDYYFRVMYEWFDRFGQRHRSCPSTIQKQTTTSATATITLSIPPLTMSNKDVQWQDDGKGGSYQAVVYLAILGDASLFYRQGSVSPSGKSMNSNAYLSYTITQGPTDTNELIYTTGGLVENIAPPAARCAHVHKNRMWLGGLETSELWFSKEFVEGEGIAFSDVFTVPIEDDGGDVTALATLDDKLIIFKKDRLYYLVGGGPTDDGNNWDYSEPQRIPSDTGTVLPNTVVTLPSGVLFKSPKGWYLLSRSFQVEYIGAAVEDSNSLTAHSATLLSDRNEVRIVHSDGDCLVYNYFFNQWSSFTNYLGVASIIVNGDTFYRLGSDGTLHKEVVGQYNDSGTKYSIAVETSWLSLAKLQGYQRVYALQLLADFVDDHQLEVQIAYDFKSTYNQTVNFTTTGVISGTVLQLRIQPAIQKCTAIKLRIVDNDTVSPSGGASLKPTSLAVEVGRKRGAARLPPAQSL